MSAESSIHELVRERTLDGPADAVKDFTEAIRKTYGDEHLIGIFMYGSMLSQVTSTSTSFPDFFVITDGYKNIFKRWSHSISARALPPHIFHLQLETGKNCKYNLLSLEQFEQETSEKASDIYILGRFGKRVALVWWRDETALDKLVACSASAMDAVAGLTLMGMADEFDLDLFILSCLNISYEGETRVEATSKVGKLFASEEVFYRKVYPELLRRHLQNRPIAAENPKNHFRRIDSLTERDEARKKLASFLKKSRMRGVLRWPKFLLTVEDWVDIILAKIERTQGIKIKPSPLQRRYPLIFGWPHFFRLLKSGAIKSAKKKSD